MLSVSLHTRSVEIPIMLLKFRILANSANLFIEHTFCLLSGVQESQTWLFKVTTISDSITKPTPSWCSWRATYSTACSFTFDVLEHHIPAFYSVHKFRHAWRGIVSTRMPPLFFVTLTFLRVSGASRYFLLLFAYVQCILASCHAQFLLFATASRSKVFFTRDAIYERTLTNMKSFTSRFAALSSAILTV